MLRVVTLTITIGATLAMAGCANDGLLIGNVDAASSTAALPARPAVDPACTALATRIDGLRRDGVVERVEKAAQGKGATVSVKRASLSQIAELEKANAEFQAKCSTLPRTASIGAPAAAVAAATPAPAAKAVKAKAAAAPKASAVGAAEQAKQ